MSDPTPEEVRALESQRTKQLQQTERSVGVMNTSLDNVAHSMIQAKRERNALLPINQLPTELLVHIFSVSIGTRSRRIYDLKAIASVAWRWNRIIKHTPMLWAVLDSTFPIKLVHTALQRAGDLPLTIRACWGLESWSTDSDMETLRMRTPGEDGLAFLTTVFLKVARWKHARLKLGTSLPSLLQYLERPAPLLERFSLKIQQGRGPSVDLFQGHCPSLAEIDISGLVVPWNSRIFQNLRSISIDDVWQHGPTVEEVIRLVGSPPRLKHFYIGGLLPGTQPQDILPVEVLHLESLTLSDVSATSTQHILSRIRAPRLNKLVVEPTLYVEDEYDLSTFFDVALSHFNPTIRSGIERAHTLHISIDWDGPNISICTRHAPGRGIPQIGDIMLDFYLKSVAEDLQLCLGLLLPSPPLCPPISLKITAGLNNIPESDLHWMLESEINNRITELCLQSAHNPHLLAFLCTGRSGGGIVKWPFPRVTMLALPREVSGKEALRLIRQRYAPTAEDFTRTQPANSDDFVYEPVDRLSQLRVEDIKFSEADYDRLVNTIVGKEDRKSVV